MEAAIALHSVTCRVRANLELVGTDQVAEISPAIDPIPAIGRTSEIGQTSAIGLIPLIGRVEGSSPAIGRLAT
jgi:hypothetical protein